MNDPSSAVRFVTNSELQAFKACRRKWYLGNHLALSPKVERHVGPLRLGSRVHEALAVHYDGGDAVAAHTVFIARDRALLTPDLLEDELKQFESESDLGRIMLQGYLEWLGETGADQGLTVVATETKLSAPLDGYALLDGFGRPIHLLGKLDLRVRREMDGAVLFLDHKTTKSFADVFGTMVLNEQFLTYQLLERLDLLARQDDSPPATGSLVNVLRKVKRTASAKPPFYAREEVHHADVELRNFWHRVHAEVADLLAAEAALAAGTDHRRVCYPRPSRDCTWSCDFVAVCHMFEDGSDADRFLAERFVAYDPLARYADDPTDPEGVAP